MRIYIKTAEGKRFWVPAPLWILKLGTGAWVERTIKKHVPKEQRQYVDYINFSELRKAINVLKEYKGLDIVDIKAKDGTIVHVRL